MQILLSSGAAFKAFSLKETENMAISLGYDGLELMPPPAHMPPAESNRDTNYASLTKAPIMHAIGDIYDKPRFKAAVDKSIEIACTAKLNIINIHPASAFFGGRQNVLDGIAYIQQKEKETGIRFIYEMLVDVKGVHPDRQEFFTQQQAYVRLEDWIQDVIEFDLHACLDTCHAGTWDIDPAELIEPLGSHLTHVHFSDFDKEKKQEHVVPGRGHVELKSFLKKLKKTHPDITLTVEINPGENKAEVTTQAKASLEFIKSTLSQPQD